MAVVEPPAVTIAELSAVDFAIVARWLSDPAVNRWLFGELRGKTCEPRHVAAMMMSHRNRLWLVNRGRTPVGLVGLANVDPYDKTAEVWYVRAPHTQSSGEVSEGVREVTKRAFRDLGLKSVRASVMANNLPSRRVVERCGFHHVGVLRHGMTFEDAMVDRVLYDIVPDDIATAR